MIYKILKFIIELSTIITAVVYAIIQELNNQMDLYEAMILALLTLIAFSAVLSDFDENRKWNEIKKDIDKEISSVASCKIKKFTNSSEWVNAMKELTKEGPHVQDTASLDYSTRSKAKKDHSAIWDYINLCCSDNKTTYRHIVRVRKNNFENLLDRILSGSANNNTYFAYYDLESTFSFPTFGIIDNKYVSTRSPYQEGEQPCYMIIENEELVKYYSRYFMELWQNAKKIDNISVLESFFFKFESQFNDKEKRSIQKKIKLIKQEGIIDDI